MENHWVGVIINALTGLECYGSKNELDTKVIKYFFEKADYEEMRNNLGNTDWKLENKTVDEQWGIISQKIKNAVEAHVPSYKGKN